MRTIPVRSTERMLDRSTLALTTRCLSSVPCWSHRTGAVEIASVPNGRQPPTRASTCASG